MPDNSIVLLNSLDDSPEYAFKKYVYDCAYCRRAKRHSQAAHDDQLGCGRTVRLRTALFVIDHSDEDTIQTCTYVAGSDTHARGAIAVVRDDTLVIVWEQLQPVYGDAHAARNARYAYNETRAAGLRKWADSL